MVDDSLLWGYGSAELPTIRENAMVAKNFIATMIEDEMSNDTPGKHTRRTAYRDQWRRGVRSTCWAAWPLYRRDSLVYILHSGRIDRHLRFDATPFAWRS